MADRYRDRYDRDRGGLYGGRDFRGSRDDVAGFRTERDWEWRENERPSYRGRGPKNYRRSDERIREDVCERLTWDDRVDASGIEINVADGVVTMSGGVPERDMKRRAEDIAESCGGVRDVQNQVRVERAER